MVGVRDESAYRQLISEFPSAIRIAVIADQELRRERDVFRSPHYGVEFPLNTVAFINRDELHQKWGLGIILCEAHFTIQNSGSITELHQQLDIIIARIIEESTNA